MVTRERQFSSPFTIELLGSCVRVHGSRNGVQKLRLSAHTDLELWGACATGQYDFQCNHTLIANGESVVLPRSPIGVYDMEQGPHYHVRRRASTPHELSSDPWVPLTLPVCSPYQMFVLLMTSVTQRMHAAAHADVHSSERRHSSTMGHDPAWWCGPCMRVGSTPIFADGGCACTLPIAGDRTLPEI